MPRELTNEEQSYLPTNRLLLEQTVLRAASKDARPAIAKSIDALVGLIGTGPWIATRCMMVFLTPAELLMDDVHLDIFRRDLVKRVAALIKELLFRTRLAQMNASRWTGIAQGSLWHAATSLLFGMSHWLLVHVLHCGGRVAPVDVSEDGPDMQRKYLGARRRLYVHFISDGGCPLLSLTFTLFNAPIREVLGSPTNSPLLFRVACRQIYIWTAHIVQSICVSEVAMLFA